MLRQVHSARLVPARSGDCGEGDGLYAAASARLGLSIASADCVPVLLAGPNGMAAVHAGWRGLSAGIVSAAVSSFPSAPSRLTAWIGPAIGPCCYEVGEEVARRVAGRPDSPFVQPGATGHSLLDLPGVAAAQLTDAGVDRIRKLGLCTRCRSELLWSYRRQGTGGGRNLSFIWRA
jgi:YfiH family protein